MTSPAVTYARQNNSVFLSGLKDLLRIPSVSALPEHKGDCRRTAEALAAEFTRIGMDNAHLIENGYNPLVYAEWLHAPGKPTVLCYGHYDVQPPDPLDEWTTPPFEPTERDGNLYGRGTADDKGQVWVQVKALESLLAANGKLPINVRVILEGDEEVGGEGIENYVATEPPELKADFALISDTEMFSLGLPTLCVGLRGMIYTEIEVHGSKIDLHSGSYGGAAPNPFMALAEILTGLKDKSGHILIPGFYDDIIPPSPEELKAWKSLPFDEEHYRETEIGSPTLVGEPGYSVMERTWARPTLDVHGMPGGFTAAGAKTVIPAKALAKVSLRLVPGMDAAKSFQQYKSYVEKIVPAGVTVEVRLLSAGNASMIRVDNPYIQTATRVLNEVWQKETVFIRSGGSVPIVGDFERHLGAPSVMMGFGLPDDNIHAPNEKFNLKHFSLGIESVIRFLEEAGK
jgi:acetylornithine deacetylase/succinyl-diaminopimelate desuccinylase-like protein